MTATSRNEFFIDPKKAFTITYQQQVISLLGSEYKNGTCVKTPPKPYSSEQCINRCYHEIYLDKCNCVVPGAGFPASDKRACSLLDNLNCLDFPDHCDSATSLGLCSTVANASSLPQCRCGATVNSLPAEVLDAYARPCQDVDDAKCYQECENVQYVLAASFQSIPNPIAIDIWEDVSFVTIQPATLNLLTIEQTEAHSLEDTIGIFGGQLGFFMGISVISVTELLEALTLISLTALWFKLRGGRGGGGGHGHGGAAEADHDTSLYAQHPKKESGTEMQSPIHSTAGAPHATTSTEVAGFESVRVEAPSYSSPAEADSTAPAV